MKKTTSLLLALIMVFALAIPAFAADDPPALASNQRGLDVGGEAVAPTITVTMPTGVVLGLNPYKMKYNGATAFFKNEKGKQDQIISPIAVIENKSDVKLDVCVEVTATASNEEITFVGTAAEATGDDKNVYLTIQVGEASDKNGTGWKSNTAPTAAVLSDDGVAYYGEKEGTVITGDTASAGEMKAITIAATDGKAANYIGFKFGGAASTAPEEAWDDGDSIDVALVFTFKPIVLDVAGA